MSDFKGALPVRGKWSVYNNDAEDKMESQRQKACAEDSRRICRSICAVFDDPCG